MKKISLIIGGTKGIGSVISKKLAKRGDEVFTLSRSEYKKKNHIVCDLSSEIDEKYLISKFKNKKIDNLIFSQRYRGSVPNMDLKIMINSTDKIIELLKSKLSKNSSITILSSIATTTVVEDQNAEYHYTRSAIEGLAKYYAVKLGPNGTRVNCIQPTVIFKPENKIYFSKKNNLTRKIIEKITPMKRMGKSEDIANLVNFLSSDESTFITGCIIPVDGGARLKSQEHLMKLNSKKTK
jgi:short-subunit dehydrogenase